MSHSLLISGVIIHLILVYSIFDIYYSSPIIFGLPSHEITINEAPSKRVVFISADGLRQDTFLQHPEKSPFLHDIIRNRKGVYGTSLSHVPTESRPGHVALFAGFTEDVSAVAKGWKKNPVPFDSVFNRSHESWLFGSPDIVDLFSDYSHVHSESYSESDEDFGSNEAYKLDEWVFERVEKLFARSLTDSDLERALKADRRVFFLHLLGLDTNGHGNKPHSKEYINNIETVDSGVARLQKMMEEYFGDNRTSFVFTSDHGMTDWGSHGAGSDEEVLTPFVVWGAGVQKGGQKGPLSQVDFAPLVSSLIGIPIPVNSVGILPVQCLSVLEKYLFQSAFANFLQLKEQLMHLRNEKAHRIGFVDYEKFGDKALSSLEEQMRKLGSQRRFSPAATLWTQHATSIKEAIFHYHRYDRSFLGACISATFILWIGIVFCHLTRRDGSEVISSSTLLPNTVLRIVLVLCALFCFYCRFPMSSWLYVLLPVFLLSIIVNATDALPRIPLFFKYCVENCRNLDIQPIVKPFAATMGGALLLMLLVLVFMDRRVLAGIFVLLMVVPSFYSQETVKKWHLPFRLLCLLLCPFPFFSTVGRTPYPSICVLSPLLSAYGLYRLSKQPTFTKKSSLLRLISISHIGTAIFIFISSYVFEKTPLLFRLLSWFSLPVAFLAPPLFVPLTVTDRLIAFAGALFIPYSLLSIAYESLFCLFFISLLALYLRFEFAHLTEVELMHVEINKKKLGKASSLSISWRDSLRACVCVCLVVCALFGTGNFASLNSFNPSTLHRFISVFSPFTMATLLVLKLLLPLLLITMVFAAVLLFDTYSIGRLSYLVLVITDLMAMCFFHQLRDSGSWLEIGMSISQYTVSMCMSVALLLLLLGSSWLLSASLHSLPFSRSLTGMGKNKAYMDEGA